VVLPLWCSSVAGIGHVGFQVHCQDSGEARQKGKPPTPRLSPVWLSSLSRISPVFLFSLLAARRATVLRVQATAGKARSSCRSPWLSQAREVVAVLPQAGTVEEATTAWARRCPTASVLWPMSRRSDASAG
jgi:hypothetical protein